MLPHGLRRLLQRRRPGPSSWHGAAAQLDGPLYAAVGAGPPAVSGWGRSGTGRNATASVTVDQTAPPGRVRITTSDRRPGGHEPDDFRLAVSWMTLAVRPDRLAFPLVLTADRWTRDVVVDDVPVPFTFVGSDVIWCALGRPGGREVSANGDRWPHEDLALAGQDATRVQETRPGG